MRRGRAILQSSSHRWAIWRQARFWCRTCSCPISWHLGIVGDAFFDLFASRNFAKTVVEPGATSVPSSLIPR